MVIGDNIVEPMAGNNIPARFVTVRGGHGKIIFNLICRSRACPDCNRNFEVEKEFDVVHVAIEQGSLMVCGKDDWAYLNVTDDTHAPDGVVWTSRPHGIHGHGSSVSFRPSQLVPGAYTVKAANDGTPSCPDVCEVHVIKVNIPTTNIFVCAEDSLASLSLSGDSYSPGGYVWSSTPDGISGRGPDKTITFVPSNLPPGKYVVQCQSADLEDCLDECEVNVLKVELVPNYDRDSDIDEDDRAKANAGDKYYFWINNDDDESADAGNDRPGGGREDWKGTPFLGKYVVDSVRDLIDFFPVWVDIKDALEICPASAYDYVLKHSAGAFNAFINSGLTPSEADKHLFNQTFCEANANAELVHINASGYTLPPAFLDAIKNDNNALILLEARAATQAPLVLGIKKKSDGTVICTAQMTVSIDSVEKMYRCVNLRNMTNPGPQPAPANYPDSLCNNKNFLFVHGYSVDEQAARGWNAEVFKRMYWSGSRAKFHAVTWFGNDSQMHIPYLGDLTPDYHVNVIHAFEAASNLAAYVNGLSGDKTVAAHSLGNMVVSAAIQDYGMSVVHYFMVDAAVASEAYDGDPSVQSPDMVHSEWDGYQTRLYCANWHTNFPSDHRRDLTWADRFENVVGYAYNFYSSGEDTLATHAHNNPPGLLDVGIFSEVHEYAWALQEKLKGRMWVAWLGGGSAYGGWGFNSGYSMGIYDPSNGVYLTATTPATAATIPNYMLLRDPYFKPGSGDIATLYGTNAAAASAFAQSNHVDLLAAFVPALSLPAGANRVDVLSLSRNYNMQNDGGNIGFQNGWPDTRTSNGAYGTRWLHSDFKNVAFPYVYLLFKKFNELGGLDAH